jgi:hypothetical protein
METTQLNPMQIEYLLTLLQEKGRRLRDEHTSALKSKYMGMEVIRQIISAMENNNQLISDLERMKKEV